MSKLPIEPSLLGVALSGDLGDLTIYQTQRGRTVAFPRTKPQKPPSPPQNTQRYRFRLAVDAWHALPSDQQAAYELVTRRLGIVMTGLNLWIHWSLCPNPDEFATIVHQAGLTLTPPPQL